MGWQPTSTQEIDNINDIEIHKTNPLNILPLNESNKTRINCPSPFWVIWLKVKWIIRGDTNSVAEADKKKRIMLFIP